MPTIIIDILIVLGYCLLVMIMQALFATITGLILGPPKGLSTEEVDDIDFKYLMEKRYAEKGGFFGMGARNIVPSTLAGFITMQGINYFYEVSWFMLGLAIVFHIVFGAASEANVGNKAMSYGAVLGLIIFSILKVLMIEVTVLEY